MHPLNIHKNFKHESMIIWNKPTKTKPSLPNSKPPQPSSIPPHAQTSPTQPRSVSTQGVEGSIVFVPTSL